MRPLVLILLLASAAPAQKGKAPETVKVSWDADAKLPTLKWTKSAAAARYDLYVNFNGDKFRKMLTTTATYYLVFAKPEIGVYEWYVTAESEDGQESAASNKVSSKEIPPPGTQAPRIPPNPPKPK